MCGKEEARDGITEKWVLVLVVGDGNWRSSCNDADGVGGSGKGEDGGRVLAWPGLGDARE